MYDNYGVYLCEQGRYEEAIQHFKESLRICPGYPEARENLCVALLEYKKYDEAITCLTEALQEKNDWPNMYKMYNNLGSAYAQKSNFALAEVNYRKALSLKPDYVPARKNLMLLLAKRGDMTVPPKADVNSQQNR
jgi:Tfp pilus assembly protein PilF